MNDRELVIQLKHKVSDLLENASSGISVVKSALNEKGILDDQAAEPLFFDPNDKGATFREVLNRGESQIAEAIKMMSEFINSH